MKRVAEAGNFFPIEQSDYVGTDEGSSVRREDRMNTEYRSRRLSRKGPVANLPKPSGDREGIDGVEAICDLVALRFGRQKIGLQRDFDFFGAMVRAKEIRGSVEI
ncbi:hypothetical protein QD357_25295 [Rhizobium sp. BR 317]|uniref:hypothetical protein n=1 Tax=Rhizobium sp. BR 317 TaxID=3040015 RepID=UPI0039BEDC8C